ncbi:MAG TPA: LLM class F420-dependent oxidoreductase [Acidimicrobiales bacterium]
MRIGVVLPQTEIGPAVSAVRAYGEGVEDLGFQHVLAYDHVVGADPEIHRPWKGPYDVDTQFHEPFVLFGFLAGCTSLDLITGITILPQRQTALVAKQAAEVDILTRGGFRLGIGIGWNPVEYEALGQDFTTRGRRLEEQVGLLRRYWTERSVTTSGEFDRVTGAGLAPLPVQRPIPIWFGGRSPRAYERMGRLADGWLPLVQPGEQLEAARALIAESALAAGRDPGLIGMEGRVDWRGDADDVALQVERWRQVGATHLSINTMGAGLAMVDNHLDALAAVSERLPLD